MDGSFIQPCALSLSLSLSLARLAVLSAVCVLLHCMLMRLGPLNQSLVIPPTTLLSPLQYHGVFYWGCFSAWPLVACDLTQARERARGLCGVRLQLPARCCCCTSPSLSTAVVGAAAPALAVTQLGTLPGRRSVLRRFHQIFTGSLLLPGI